MTILRGTDIFFSGQFKNLKGKQRQHFYGAYIKDSRREGEWIPLFRKSAKFICLGDFYTL